jgi:hypothetical protein
MENFIQLKKDNILRIGIKTADGKDTGEHLEFDMEDVELPLRINECEAQHRKNINDLRMKTLLIDKKEDKKGKKILSKQTIDLMFTPQVEDRNGISLNNEKRSVGWIVKGAYPNSADLASKNTIMHTGFTGTNIVIDTDNKAGFSLLTNRVHPTRANNKVISFRSRLGNYIFSHLEEL